jgi:serine/threonine protein kinase
MAGGRTIPPHRIIRFPPFELDVRAAELRKHGTKIRLHDQPFRILLTLLNHPGEVVLREEIRKVLWPNDTVVEFDRSINAAIQRLRDALGDTAGNPRYVETLARRGYRFIGVVEADEVLPNEQPTAAPDPNDLSGQTFSHFLLIGKLGSGGMGVVYRAEDLKLGRQVALKLLPVPVSEASPELLDRFRREARAASALSHANICTIHGVDEFAGHPVIVMELVEGETLAARVARGPLAWKEALPAAIQIAGAMGAAHRKGIVHRDLKPANIMLAKSGVKVLDFGLAKMESPALRVRPAGEVGAAEVSQPGLMLGTCQYMSPEQVLGKETDARSDIFSFGLILYEMLTGERTFTGDSAPGVMAAILQEPAPALSAAAPPGLEWLLQRCLAKDPEDRWQTAGDLKAELERIAAPPAVTRVATRRRSFGPALAGLFVLLVAGLALLLLPRAAAPTQAMEFEIGPPPDAGFPNPDTATAISPDGQWIVFRSQPSNMPATLWLRPLDSPVARSLAGTDGGDSPFWSPDGKSLAFFAGRKLKRIEIAGGPPVTLCDAVRATGGSWSKEGVLLFTAGNRTLLRIPAKGGVPEKVTETDPGRTEIKHMGPQFLPDGRHFLYLIKGTSPNTNGIYVGSLDRPRERRRLLAASYKAIYTAHAGSRLGSLLWLRQQTLMAQSFDPGGLRLIGEPVAIADNVAVDRFDEAAFWASDTGILIYHTSAINSALGWVSRDGKILERVEPGGRFDALTLSPDSKRVALCRADADNNSDIWIYEFGRKIMTRLTFDSAPVDSPVWSPDGRQLAFASSRNGTFQIYRKSVDESGPEEQLTDGQGDNFPDDWSRDGRYLLYQQRTPEKSFTVWLLPFGSGRKPVPLLQKPFQQILAVFSPDGRWIAYESNESGSIEVYLQAFSGLSAALGGKVQVSAGNGGWPRWRGDGKEIFYEFFRNPSAMMSARVRTGSGGIEADAPVQVFPFGGFASTTARAWDVTADGQRFLLSGLAGPSPGSRLNVVVNWQARVKE